MTVEEEGCPVYTNYTYVVPVISRLDIPHINIPKVSQGEEAKETGTNCIKSGEHGVRVLVSKMTSMEHDDYRLKLSPDNPPSTGISIYVLTLLSLLALYFLCIHHENKPLLLNSMPEPLGSPDDKMADLVQLVLRVHDSLNKLNVAHFLCYSTLWGAVYTGAIFHWDRAINLCVLEEDISRADEALLHDTFRRVGVESSYSSFHGFYRLKLREADGTLTVFRKVAGKRVKAGFGTRLLLLFHKGVESFPNRLLESSFVNVSFYGGHFLVPKESVSFIKSVSPSELLDMINR